MTPKCVGFKRQPLSLRLSRDYKPRTLEFALLTAYLWRIFPYSALLLRGPFVASVKKTTSETVNNPFVFWNSQQRSEGNILVALMSSRESKRSILNRNKAQYRVQDLWKNYSTVRWNRWRLFRLILSRWQKCNNSAKSFYSKFWCYFSESVKGLIDICRRTDCC